MILALLACAGEAEHTDGATDTAASVTEDGAWATIAGGSVDALGNEVLHAGDPDGDGDGDLLVAAYLGNRVCLVPAPLGAGDTTVDAAGACLTGENEDDFAGYGVAAAGDATGDGVDDLLVGSIANDDAGEDAGKLYLVPGPVTAGDLGSRALASFTGETAGDYAGLRLARGGDLTGDGVDDFLVGAPGYDGEGGGGGRAYVIAGPVSPGAHRLADAAATVTGLGGATPEGPQAPPHGAFGTGDFVGDALSGPGDFDGDGLTDLALGATGDATLGQNTGKVAIFSGPLSGNLLVTDADRTLVGPAAGAYAGSPLLAVPDLDGDGLDDLLVAMDGLGAVHVVTATSTLDGAPVRLLGEAPQDLFGYALDAGDADGDGDVDLAVGAPGSDRGAAEAGAVWLFAGPFAPGTLEAADAARVFAGEVEGETFGGALALLADANADGLTDLAIGARDNDLAGAFAGMVYVFTANPPGTP